MIWWMRTHERCEIQCSRIMRHRRRATTDTSITYTSSRISSSVRNTFIRRSVSDRATYPAFLDLDLAPSRAAMLIALLSFRIDFHGLRFLDASAEPSVELNRWSTLRPTPETIPSESRESCGLSDVERDRDVHRLDEEGAVFISNSPCPMEPFRPNLVPRRGRTILSARGICISLVSRSARCPGRQYSGTSDVFEFRLRFSSWR